MSSSGARARNVAAEESRLLASREGRDGVSVEGASEGLLQSSDLEAIGSRNFYSNGGSGGGDHGEGGANSSSLMASPLNSSLRRRTSSDARSKPYEDVEERLVSFLELIVMNSFVGAYGLIQVSMFMLVLPKQCATLFPGSQAVGLASMLGLAGATQLICPVAGLFSDRMTSPFGRRRPFIVVSTAVALLALAVMWFVAQGLGEDEDALAEADEAGSTELKAARNMYVAAFVMLNLALNVCFAAYAGLIPDLVGESQIGQASGTMAVMNALGSLIGVWMIGFLMVEPFSVYAGWLIVCCVVTLLVVKETPRTTPVDSIACREIFNVYFESLETNRDFLWVWISRLCYYMGISVQVFMQYFIRDIIHTTAEEAKEKTAMVSIIMLISCAVVAVPCGSLSDRVGRRPLVYLSCVLMAIVYLGWTFATKLWHIFAWSALFGIANGTYLSVDYALGCDKIPDRDEGAAQALGVWGVAAFLGSTLGPVISGPLLYFTGSTSESDVYSHTGYVALLGLGAFFVLLSSLALRFVSP